MPPKPQSKNKRPTHFLCFPLVTDESISQLSDSLAYFRSITTPLEHGSQSNTSAAVEAGFREETLRILPPAAHRPPGTFHLTLGTMDLSDEEDLNLATRLLHQIDYVDLLRAAEVGGVSDHLNRRREGKVEHGNGGAEAEVDPKARDALAEEEEVEAETPAASEEGEAAGQSQNKPQAAIESPATLLHSLARAITPPPLRAETSLETRPASDSSTLIPEIPIPARLSTSLSSQPAPLSITLFGLGTFPRPSTSRVFYAQPHDPTSRLLPFGNAVRRIFQEASLITETRPLVLHATVANMIYVKDRSRGSKGKGRGRGAQAGTVDARDILRYFNDGPAGSWQSRQQISASPASASASSQPFVSFLTKGETIVFSTSSESEMDGKFIWAKDIKIDRIRICKMGAEQSNHEGLGMEYKHIAEEIFFS
ncbi:hypothetical protein A1O1_05472 [Capronia coronata CBS 617.96]|uniref:A-kinase anchor protein 7-like phosphoesterase domain-containing protein n=1 Tax=Capronia coronata CBS 617.96 TaxID=1182541 RepID=W9Y6S9_9EURO|nr:uncharacterized protein A1O1_05472 [Capronia coronata CBS 617.96]EXJ88542.1 hypothetical protein A1O1_05472 [Capronia coronata CBS 617.96]